MTLVFGSEIMGEDWRGNIEPFAEHLSQANDSALQLAHDLLTSQSLKLRARGWLAVLLASARGGSGQTALVSLIVDAAGSLDDPGVAALRPFAGPLIKDFRLGLRAAQQDQLGQLSDRFARGVPLRSRRLVVAAAQSLWAAQPSTEDGSMDLLLKLAVRRVRDQELLVALASELAGAASAADGADPPDAARLASYSAALWTVIALGRFELRHGAVCALGGLAAALGDPQATELLAQPPEGSPGSLAERSELEAIDSRFEDLARVRQALCRQYRRYSQVIQALAGDVQARAELLRSMSTEGSEVDFFVSAFSILLAPELWRRSTGEPREELRKVLIPLLDRTADLSTSRGPESPQAHQGRSFVLLSLCRAAERLRSETELAGPSERAIRELFKGVKTGITTTLDDALDEYRVAKAAYAAMASLVSDSVSSRTTSRNQLCQEVERVAKDADGSDHSWWRSGWCEAVLGALPMLLVGSEGEKWKRGPLSTLAGLVEAIPSDPIDSFRLYRYLAAWSAVTSLFEAIRVQLLEGYPIFALSRLGDGETVQQPRFEEILAESFVEFDTERLLRFCRPQDQALISLCDSVTGTMESNAQALLPACALEFRVLESLPARFAAWDRLVPYEKFWLSRTFRLLATGSAADFLTRSDERGRLSPRLARIAEEAGRLAGIHVCDRSRSRSEIVLSVLRTMPKEAAAALAADLQSIVEMHLPEHKVGPADRKLDDDVLAVCAPNNSYQVCEELARWIERFQLQARVSSEVVDISETLYQLVLAGSSPDLFAHLAVRLEDPDERRLTELVLEHTLRLQDIQETQPAAERLHRIAQHSEELHGNLGHFGNVTVGNIRELLGLYLDLSRVDWISRTGSERGSSTLPSQEIDRLRDLFARADAISRDLGRNLRLAEKTETDRLRRRLLSYFEIGVEQFTEREEALKALIHELGSLEEQLGEVPSLHPPLAVMLSTLLSAWQEQFREILEREVQRGHHLVRISDLRGFHKELVGGDDSPFQSRFSKDKAKAYERFFVRWAADRFDLSVLKETIVGRWSWPLRQAYGVVTNFWSVLAIIAAPYLLLAALSQVGSYSQLLYELRAGGFAVATLVVFGVLLVVLCVGGMRLYLEWHRGADKGTGRYVFQCFLPRLIGLIVIPMALVLDASYSHSFPLAAPGGVILLLLVLTFLGTVFYVVREVAGHSYVGPSTKPHQRLVFQITGLALFEAFASALVLSALFGLYSTMPDEQRSPESAVEASTNGDCERRGINESDVFWVVPRCVELDLTSIIPDGEKPQGFWEWLRRLVKNNGPMVFLPVTILVWTALGLFSGIFLEGFLRTSAAVPTNRSP